MSICLLVDFPLGHDASFGYIEAVNLTQHDTLMARRLGYMASCMFLHKNPDLVGMLLVNSLQKDLSCSDVMRVSIQKTPFNRTRPKIVTNIQNDIFNPKDHEFRYFFLS